MSDTNLSGVFVLQEVRERILADIWLKEFNLLFLNYGWFGGGGSPTLSTTVERITFDDDTSTASVRGPLSLARFNLDSTRNMSYGWFGGGYLSSPHTPYSRVDRINFAEDTSTASVRGPLSLARFGLAATGNMSYGWFGGGSTSPSLTHVSRVDRIDFATDTGTASAKGPLSSNRTYLAATGNMSYGWFGGGIPSPAGPVSTVDRIDFADDTATVSVRGPLSLARQTAGGVSDFNYGWFAVGYAGPSIGSVSRVDRINFASDTGTASVRGPLTFARNHSTGTGNQNYGWFNGFSSSVERIIYSSDAVSATVRGTMNSVRESHAAV